jgi:hypothetical protein
VIPEYGKNLEGAMIQAAMAATTSTVQIGCLVHAIGYRNPNLLAEHADMWHVFGTMEKMQDKIERLELLCQNMGV